jgi:hypothetical protein
MYVNIDDDAETVARKAAIEALQEREWRLRERDEHALVLESDIAFAVWARKQSSSTCPPFVRAEVYGDKIDSRCELWDVWENRDPRRPVLMRGSKGFLTAVYGKNGWHGRVVERYLRIVKYTCFDQAMHEAMQRRVRDWARKRFYVSYHFDNQPVFMSLGERPLHGNTTCWFKGEHHSWISGEQFRALKARHAKESPAKPIPPSRKKLKKKDADREARILARALYDLGIVNPGETE